MLKVSFSKVIPRFFQMSSSSYMSTAVMSQPFTVTSHHSNPAASSNQSSITTPAGKILLF